MPQLHAKDPPDALTGLVRAGCPQTEPWRPGGGKLPGLGNGPCGAFPDAGSHGYRRVLHGAFAG